MSAIPSSVDPNLHDISLHVKPGKERAPFFRYIRINLPKLTRAMIVAIMALQGDWPGTWRGPSFRFFPSKRLSSISSLHCAPSLLFLAP